MHAATVEAAMWWARPRGDQARNWIANYQQSLQTRHRLAISEIVGQLQPGSLLEVGCHCGPNLLRLALDHPGLSLAGVDASAEAIEAGQHWMQQRAVADRVELKAGRFPEVTDTLPSGCVDVVLSCYTLAYVAPPDLDVALAEIGRLARRAVILAEPMHGPGRQTMGGYHEWHHDYEHSRKWIPTLRSKTVRSVAVDPKVDALTNILVFE